MQWFKKFINHFTAFFHQFGLEMSLDFGSANTRLMLNGKLVWDQPTLIVLQPHHEAVIAVGQSAISYHGKLPSQVKLVTPISQGAIVDLDAALLYLQSVLRQLRSQKKIAPWSLINLKTTVGAHLTPLEKKQLIETLSQAGFRITQPQNKAAAYVNLPELKKIKLTHGVIDIGAQTTEVSILAGQEVIKMKSITQVAGDHFTQVVMKQVLAHYHLELSVQTAEKIKQQLGEIYLGSEGKQNSKVATVVGKDTQTGLAVTVKIEAAVFQEDFQHLLKQLLVEIKTVFDDLPAEMITQIQEQGFYLTGGGSQLINLPSAIQSAWDIPVVMSSNPTQDLVLGIK
jgi:rod shape-determining protein MreB